MSSNGYKQLLMGGMILGLIIFFSNHLLSYAQESSENTDESSDETPRFSIPSIFSGQEQGQYQNSVIQREIIQQQQNQEEENIVPIPGQHGDIGEEETQEELEEDDITASSSSRNIIEEKGEDGQDNPYGSNNDIHFELPFP
jgi:hypothetical protein